MLVSAGFMQPAIGQNLFIRHAADPLPVRFVAAESSRSEWLVGRDGALLEFKVDVASENALQRSLESGTTRIEYDAARAEGMLEGLNAYRDGDLSRAIPLMRPQIYAMIRFVDLPEDQTNFGIYVSRYIEGLLQTGSDFNEAYRLISRLDLATVPLGFKALAVRTVQVLAAEGDVQSALDLVSQLPAGEEMKQVAPVVLEVADQLREEDKPQEALALYERAEGLFDGPKKDLTRLWIAYCHSELGSSRTADAFLATLSELGDDREEYPLLLLIRGKMELGASMNGNFRDAMNLISRGVVLADLSDPWTPELNYFAAICYEKLGDDATARQIYEENRLLYPQSPWTGKGLERLAELPAS